MYVRSVSFSLDHEVRELKQVHSKQVYDNKQERHLQAGVKSRAAAGRLAIGAVAVKLLQYPLLTLLPSALVEPQVQTVLCECKL